MQGCAVVAKIQFQMRFDQPGCCAFGGDPTAPPVNVVAFEGVDKRAGVVTCGYPADGEVRVVREGQLGIVIAELFHHNLDGRAAGGQCADDGVDCGPRCCVANKQVAARRLVVGCKTVPTEPLHGEFVPSAGAHSPRGCRAAGGVNKKRDGKDSGGGVGVEEGVTALMKFSLALMVREPYAHPRGGKLPVAVQ